MEQWWLITQESVDVVRNALISINTPEAEHALMILDTSMHKCDVKPWDM